MASRAMIAASRTAARAPVGARGMAALKPQPLKNWWKYHKHTEGMVTRTLSPYELKVVEPLFADLGHTVKHRVMDFLPVVPGIVAFVGTYWGSCALYDKWCYEHRA